MSSGFTLKTKNSSYVDEIVDQVEEIIFGEFPSFEVDVPTYLGSTEEFIIPVIFKDPDAKNKNEIENNLISLLKKSNLFDEVESSGLVSDPVSLIEK